MKQPSKKTPISADLGLRLKLYSILFTKFNQEGNGIWARFNIVIGINLLFFSWFGYVYFHRNDVPNIWHNICIGISLGSFIISVWSIYVQKRLWYWHTHWRNMLIKIENFFPNKEGWVKPHWQLPPGLGRDPGLSQTFWPPQYTLPFLYVLAIAWGVLLILLLTGTL